MKRGRVKAGGWVGAVVALALGLSLAACSATGPASIVGQQTLRIGVKADQPGLGQRLPGRQVRGIRRRRRPVRRSQAGRSPRSHHLRAGDFGDPGGGTGERLGRYGDRDLLDHPGARDEGHLRRAVLRSPPGHHGPRRRHRDPQRARPQGKAAVRGHRLQLLEARHAGAEHRSGTDAGRQLQRMRRHAAGSGGSTPSPPTI